MLLATATTPTLIGSVPALQAVPGAPERLDMLLTQAREAWPGVKEPPALADFLAARWPADSRGAEEALTRLNVKDLYLACACSAQDQTAIAHLSRRPLNQSRTALRRAGADDALIDETLQRVLEGLLVARGDEPPRIEQYSGRGALSTWLKSICLRTAFRAMRAAAGVREEAWLWAKAGDPELSLLADRFGDRFKAAFAAALAKLTPRERVVLRQHHLDGLTLQQLARLHVVHRSTIARWLAEARDTILQSTRASLAATCGLRESELDSLMRLLRQTIDVSLTRLLTECP